MRATRSKLNYANVVATIALFLALGGGAAFAASKIKTSQIAKNAIKKNQLAKNSVTKDDFSKGALIVSTASSSGTLLNVAPTPPAANIPITLSGKSTFTPKKGTVGLLMAEVKGTVAAAAPPASCNPFIVVQVNGENAIFLALNDVPDNSATPSTGTPFQDVDRGTAPIGLTGGTQKITAAFNGDTGCSATSKIDSLKVAVQQSR